MLQLQKEVAQFRKDKQNPFHKYGYASATGVNDAIKDKLTELEIVAQLQIEHTGTIAEKVLIATATLTLIDPDDGSFMEFQSIGSGTDAGDKHAMKAATAAQKYATIAAVFGATNDDPEADAKVDDKSVYGAGGKEARQEMLGQLQEKVVAEKEKLANPDAIGVMITEVKGEPKRVGRGPYKLETAEGTFQSFDKATVDKISVGRSVVYKVTKYGNDIIEVVS